jgi:hypothetical protein
MRAIRPRYALLMAAVLALSGPSARAGDLPYRIDILSSDRYPQLKDAWMFRINNQGVAAGYIATASPAGPYLPTSYAGGGQFTSFGIQSSSYIYAVTGLNDLGDAVGNVFDPSFNPTPYIYHNGAVSHPDFSPTADTPFLYGINNGGVAYGSYFDDGDGLAKVFTVGGNTATPLPLSADGFHNFDSGPRALTDTGLLAVTGYSDDFSTSQGFVYDLAKGSLHPLALPDGFANFTSRKITPDGVVFGEIDSADYSVSRLGSWGADGSFRGFFDIPAGMDLTDVLFNDLGQGVGLLNGHLMFYDGTSWGERDVLGLDGYTLSSISDMNDRGDIVGLVRNAAGTFEWGFVASAVPEPGSLLLATIGLIPALAFARKGAGGRRGRRRSGSLPLM